MSWKPFYLLVAIIVASQLFGMAVISNKLAGHETERMHIPDRQLMIDHQDNGNSHSATNSTCMPTEAALRKMIRSALHKELNADLAGLAHDATGMQPSETGQSPSRVSTQQRVFSPEQLAESEKHVVNVIENAIQNGIWTAQDNIRLTGKLHMLNLQQQRRLLDKIIGALERGELKLADGVVPIL